MTAGGYIFRKVDLTYDPNTNGATVLDWAKAIHEARCQAFFDAAKAYYTSIGEPYGWYTLAAQGYGNTYSLINLGSNPLFITQDIHDSSSQGSANADAPALFTIFTNEVSGSYYCILTYLQYNCYYQNNPTSYGLYLPQSSVLPTISGQFCCGGSLSHCYAKSGGITTGPVNIKDSNFLVNNCTHIMAAYSPIRAYATSPGYDYSSLLYDRYSNGQNSANLVGKTFQFGYAVKDEQIISMMRRSDNKQWLWSIIGDIFDVTMSDSDKCLVGCIVNDYISQSDGGYGETTSSIRGTIWSNYAYGRVSFCKADGSLYRQVQNYVYTDYSRGSQFSVYPCIRTSTSIPDDTLYNAVAVCAFSQTYSNSTGDNGVDGLSNGCKGFISTDLLRMVSAGLCQSECKYFSGNKFISMVSPSNYATTGFLLGWDPSNTANML